MESSVHSDSKCNSDFSIKRILGEEDDTVRREVPSWLCCTRYQPPRLPRAAGGASCRVRRSGRHARVPFTAAQAAALEAAYSRAPYLAPPALRALAAALQLRDDRIKIWFQNRRARERREKCNTIAPPQAVTLAPTSQQVIPKRSWIPNDHINTIEGKLENPVTENQHHRSVEICLVRPCLTEVVRSNDDCERDRCDSPLDVET